MPRPRLLVLSRNLPPLTGGMERLSWQVLAALEPDFDIHVIGPRGCRRLLPPGVHGHACLGVGAASYLTEAAVVATLRALAWPRPDAVLATSGLTAPIARVAAALTRRPYAVMVHGLDLVADSGVYQRVFVPAIAAAHCVIANSGHTARLGARAGVKPASIRVIHPGVDWPQRPLDGRAWRERHDLLGRPLLLMVGRQTRRKGLAEFLEHCMPSILADFPDALLLVVGGTAAHAIRKEDSVAARVDAAVARHGLGPAVRLLGGLPDDELAEVYAAADAHVFPLVRVKGDVEGFGMVAVEAAAQGTPTIAFDEGGVADAIVPGETGALIPGGDYLAFTNAVIATLAQRHDVVRRAACHAAAARHAWAARAAEWRAALAALPRR